MSTPITLRRDRFVDSVTSLKQVGIGASTLIGGHVVHREAENTFRLHYNGEAMFGSADTVVDWIEQLKN